MYGFSMSYDPRPILRALAGGLLLAVVAGCGRDGTGPSSTDALTVDSTGTAPADTAAAPSDSTASNDSASTTPDSAGAVAGNPMVESAIMDTRSSAPGIVFGSTDMDYVLLNSVHTGTLKGGGLSTTSIISLLSAVRSRGGRIVIKLCNGHDFYVQNSDGTFSFTKWKQLVDRFKVVNLGPYIADGTIIGHYLIDEPQNASRWGGKVIPQSTLEAMAQYSKQNWPTMTTFVRTVPSWLAKSSVNYTYLDAGWAQYTSSKGNVSTWIVAEVNAAKSKGLGLAVGLNVINGGNGSSGIRGTRSGTYSMSASELKTYGTALLGQSYSCAFYMWQYNSTYYGRSDVKTAMADLSSKARSHAKTGCRQ